MSIVVVSGLLFAGSGGWELESLRLFVIDGFGDERGVLLSIRRQRQMCIRERCMCMCMLCVGRCVCVCE